MLLRKPLLTGMRAVALFEAAKGTLVLLAGLGVLTLIHRDVQAVAEHLVRMSHLNPASRYPRIFIAAASNVTDARLWFLAGAAAFYSIVRWVEAYGLWKEYRWAEWFALLSGGMYLPMEVYEIIARTTWIRVGVLVSNIAIVAYMTYALLHSGDQDRELAKEDKSASPPIDDSPHPIP